MHIIYIYYYFLVFFLSKTLEANDIKLIVGWYLKARYIDILNRFLIFKNNYKNVWNVYK